MKKILGKLASNDIFTPADFEEAIQFVISNEATNSQLGAFIALSNRIPRHPSFLSAFASKVLAPYEGLRQKVSDEIGKTKANLCFLDIVGTGGDGFNTFNASTAAGIVVSGCSNQKNLKVFKVFLF